MNLWIKSTIFPIFFLACMMASFSLSAKVTDKPNVLVIHDFKEADRVNRLGGASGSWNMDPTDINDSWTDEDFTIISGPDGEPTQVLRLSYSVDSNKSAQNGFWTKLMNLDANDYDHLEFVLKGDVEKGFTKRFKVEVKKCKGVPCVGDSSKDEVIKGSYDVAVTAEWKTVSIPLNRITGIIDFSNPKEWEDPNLARKDLDELVIVFHDRHVTKKKGVIYIDQIRLVHTGDFGPTAVDFPPRTKEKTETKIEGLEFAKFLAKRLGGFPETTLVKKEFSENPKEFLRTIAEDTWRFFDEVVDQEHGLPLDTIQLAEGDVALAEGAWIGDYTNVTNIGVYLMCLVSAYDLGFLTRPQTVERIQRTLTTMEQIEHHESGWPYNYYDTTTAERTSYFVSLVDSAWLLSGYYVVKHAFPEELGEQVQNLIDRASLGFFYDPVERQMFHGFYEHLQVYSDYHYGTFYTEPRVASYMAIARKEVPEDHWYGGLIRTFPRSFEWQNQTPLDRIEKEVRGHKFYSGYYEWEGIRFIPSWGGSAFEALMPTLVLMEKELAPKGLGLNNARHVEGQIRYALETAGQPVWGMSPSSVPEGGYSEYGAKPFGSKGYKAGVVTPHASVLALEYATDEVIENLRELIQRYDIYGEYGFYDAVTVETGLVARKYLALDQGMILVAINNYLNDGAIRKRFHQEQALKQTEYLLTDEHFFEIPRLVAASSN